MLYAGASGKLREFMEQVRTLVWVFLGGGVGAACRVALAQWLDDQVGDRLAQAGILAANILGCLLIGIASSVIRQPLTRSAVMGGFLGGLTTFSSFGLLTVDLARDDKLGSVALHWAGHLVLGVGAVIVGLWIGAHLRPADGP